MTFHNSNNSPEIKISFKEYLFEIYNNPQKIHEAYRYFHNYSARNRILAISQLINPEPINTFNGWKKLNRKVKKGSKAISLFLPVSYKVEQDNKNVPSMVLEATSNINVGENQEDLTFTKYVLAKRWFPYSHTEANSSSNNQKEGAEELKEDDFVDVPDFDIKKALEALGIKKVPFAHINGNAQGYALPNQNIIAINPMAYAPYKTSLHEIAHCLLHKREDKIIDTKILDISVKEFEAETTAYLVCCSLGKFDHLDYSRGYIASWINGEIKEENFKRAFEAANQILRAGEVMDRKEKSENNPNNK